MTRRVLMILLSAIFLLASSPIAYADVVMGNDFQSRHKDEIQKLDRVRFCANGPDGYVTIRETPGWENEEYLDWHGEISEYQNGEELFMHGYYTLKGEYWGLMEIGTHRYYPPGWIPMDRLLAIYTPIDFEEENKDSFHAYTGNYNALYAAERIVLWQWPGSDREKRVLDNDGLTLKSANALRAYTDKEGCEWGYIEISYTYPASYYTSHAASWICLTDPANSQIPAFNPAPKPVKWSPDGVYQWTHIDISDNTVEQYALSNITKVMEYKQNETFTDVTENAWYRAAVALAYEYAIIAGKGNNRFDPGGYLTGPEALTIASRIHAYYKYGEEAGTRLLADYNRANHGYGIYWSGTWWYGALEYCKAEGLVRGSDFIHLGDDNPPPPITRAELVHIWAKILQPKDMKKQNTVVKLPDVNTETAYSSDILLFYEVGIVGGVDAQGTFKPNSNITRAEAATIFMKIIDVSKRHNGRTFG